MTTSQGRSVAVDIEAAILAVPGVSAVYRSGAPASNAIAAGMRILGKADGAPALVRLEQATEGLCVEVSIGVHAGASAARASRDVHAAIAALCAAQGLDAVEIRVTVVHIDEMSS